MPFWKLSFPNSHPGLRADICRRRHKYSVPCGVQQRMARRRLHQLGFVRYHTSNFGLAQLESTLSELHKSPRWSYVFIGCGKVAARGSIELFKIGAFGDPKVLFRQKSLPNRTDSNTEIHNGYFHYYRY